MVYFPQDVYRHIMRMKHEMELWEGACVIQRAFRARDASAVQRRLLYRLREKVVHSLEYHKYSLSSIFEARCPITSEPIIVPESMWAFPCETGKRRIIHYLTTAFIYLRSTHAMVPLMGQMQCLFYLINL